MTQRKNIKNDRNQDLLAPKHGHSNLKYTHYVLIVRSFCLLSPVKLHMKNTQSYNKPHAACDAEYSSRQFNTRKWHLKWTLHSPKLLL